MRLRRSVAVALTAALAAPAAVTGLGGPAGAATSTDLFFSEYIEGTGFNKAIEIFNGTGAPIDLAAGGYTLELYSNGAASPSQSVALTGTVADGDVFVVSRAAILPAKDRRSARSANPISSMTRRPTDSADADTATQRPSRQRQVPRGTE